MTFTSLFFLCFVLFHQLGGESDDFVTGTQGAVLCIAKAEWIFHSAVLLYRLKLEGEGVFVGFGDFVSLGEVGAAGF